MPFTPTRQHRLAAGTAILALAAAGTDARPPDDAAARLHIANQQFINDLRRQAPTMTFGGPCAGDSLAVLAASKGKPFKQYEVQLLTENGILIRDSSGAYLANQHVKMASCDFRTLPDGYSLLVENANGHRVLFFESGSYTDRFVHVTDLGMVRTSDVLFTPYVQWRAASGASEDDLVSELAALKQLGVGILDDAGGLARGIQQAVAAYDTSGAPVGRLYVPASGPNVACILGKLHVQSGSSLISFDELQSRPDTRRAILDTLADTDAGRIFRAHRETGLATLKDIPKRIAPGAGDVDGEELLRAVKDLPADHPVLFFDAQGALTGIPLAPEQDGR